MTEQNMTALDRRQLLTRVMPACSLACLCGGLVAAAGAGDKPADASEAKHKFDVEFETKTTTLKQVNRQNYAYMEFIKTLEKELGEEETVRLLNICSAEVGRQVGNRQKARSPDTSFATYTATFRPPAFDKFLTLEIVEDTDKVFELKVTECVSAKVFREAGLGGKIGHAAVCNMDFYWPQAFNENFKMERDKTLMQGDDCCNHRYIDTA